MGRIAASGSRPGLAELDEIALENAGFRASERDFSEVDLERTLDTRSNVALRGPEWEFHLNFAASRLRVKPYFVLSCKGYKKIDLRLVHTE